ncbi:MAG: hypothetical protein HYX92_15055 [Chloroflexi bacterium]|nr:hypothetical protein [Chloroflexota bacterium]
MTRVREPKISPRLQRAVAELQQMIREHYPTAQFKVSRADDDPREVHLITTVDIEDTEQVLDVVMDRLLELQVDERLPIHVIPLRPVERVLAEAAKAAKERSLHQIPPR